MGANWGRKIILMVALLVALAEPAASAPVGFTQTLSSLLDAHDFPGLAKALNNPPSPVALSEGLVWERDRMLAGASAFVALRYATDLWQLANMQGKDEIKQTAALAMLYAVAADTIDGKRCKDVSAPGHRIEQFAPALRPIMIYLRALTVDARKKLSDLAVKLDARTLASPSRRADWFLCSGGIEEIEYGLSHGSQKSVPTPPGHLGRTVAVDTKGYKPEFLSEQASAKAVAEERARLSSTVGQFAGL